MNNIEVLSGKIRELCSECKILRSENDRLLKNEERLKEKLKLLEEQTKAVDKIARQNEFLNKERLEVKNRLSNIKIKLEKVF